MQRTQPLCRDEELVQQVDASRPQVGEAHLWWLTQASWLVKTAEVTIVIDPWWRDVHAEGHWAKLLGEYPLHPSAFPRLDYVLCTHWHDDHLCPESIPQLAESQPWLKFVIPSRSIEEVESWGVTKKRLIAAHGHGPLALDGLRAWCVPAAHEELDFDETGASWYLGYVIESGGFTFYHMGDGQPWPGWHSAICKAAKRLSGRAEQPLDLALLCINGNDNLHHQQAVDLCEMVCPRTVIPMHYGMDPNNTVEPVIFERAMKERLPQHPFRIAEVGGLIRIEDGAFS